MSLSEFVLENTPELREAIVRRNVRDVVAEKIAMLIASGIFKVGDDLPSERDLAAALQVSRESVRGGVQILAARDCSRCCTERARACGRTTSARSFVVPASRG